MNAMVHHPFGWWIMYSSRHRFASSSGEFIIELDDECIDSSLCRVRYGATEWWTARGPKARVPSITRSHHISRGTVMNLAFIFQFDDEFMITFQNDDIYVARINLDSSWILIFEWRLTGFIISMISKGAESRIHHPYRWWILDSSPIRVMNLEFITHIRVMNAMVHHPFGWWIMYSIRHRFAI